jgi:putative flippase GtrA
MRSMLVRGPRYVAVSVVCVLINNLLLIGLDSAGVYYGLNVLISAALMIPLSFAMQVHITFACEPSWRAFAKYAAVMLVHTPAAWLLLALIHDRGGVPMLYSAPIVTVLMFVWNFVGSHWALLARKPAASSPA